jgi:hypothetical protein
MTNLYAQETVVSERDNGDRVVIGESPVYETFTDKRGELFRAYRGEHGRCISKVYCERKCKDESDKAIGWVFLARRPFEDDPSQSSLIETWVIVHTAPPTVATYYSYAEVSE